MFLQAFQQFESAEACYRRAHSFDPKSFRWAYYLGLVQAQNGKSAPAAVSLQDATRIDPGYVPARIKLAEVLLAAGRQEESRQVSESLVRDNPQLAPAHYWLGRVAAAGGKTAEAAEHYQQACDLWTTYGSAHYALALADRQAGKSEEAQRHMVMYQKYQADGDPQPEDPLLEEVRALDNSALAHLMKGVDFENVGQFAEAISEHEEAVRQDPRLIQAQTNLISLYARTGQNEKAEHAYRSAVALNPNLPQSHYDYGVYLAARGRFSDAEAAFRKALDASPHYAEAHSNLGAMLERRGKIADALAEYQAAIQDKPNFRQAHYQLGRLQLAQGKTDDAIANLRQTLTPEDESTPRFLFALGVAYAEKSDFASAGQTLQRAGESATALGQAQLAAEIQATLGKVEQRASAK